MGAFGHLTDPHLAAAVAGKAEEKSRVAEDSYLVLTGCFALSSPLFLTAVGR